MRTSCLRRALGLATVLVLAFAFMASLGTAPAGATSPGDNGKIAFLRSDGYIYTINPGSTGIKKLVQGTGPVWSPDGRSIAFNRDDAIWTMRADGTDQRKILRGVWGSMAWSPRGNRIAYSRWAPESGGRYNYNLWTVRADGSGARQLTHSASVPYTEPAWSPDGTHIAFTAGDQWRGQIWIMNADGSGPRQLTSDSNGSALEASWSPGGARIAFTGLWDGSFNVWAINVDGTGLRELTHGGVYDWYGHPSWSPNGTRIAYESSQTGTMKIWTMGAGGANPHQVTWWAPASDRAPDWQPVPN